MKNETKLLIVVLVLSLALPAISYWSFRTGYLLHRELSTPQMIFIPPTTTDL